MAHEPFKFEVGSRLLDPTSDSAEVLVGHPHVCVGNTLQYKEREYRVFEVRPTNGTFDAIRLPDGKMVTYLDWALSPEWLLAQRQSRYERGIEF